MKIKKFNLKIWPFLLSILVFTPILSTFVFSFITTPHTYILDRDLSLQKKSQVESTLNNIHLPHTIDINYNTQTDQLNIATISAQIDTKATADQLFSSSLKHKIFFTIPQNYFLKITVDDQRLDDYIDSLSQKTNTPFMPSEIVVSDSGQISVNQGSLGLSLNRSKLKQDILFQLSNLDSSPITASLDTIGFIPNQTQIDQVISQAEILKNKNISLNIPDTEAFLIDSSTILSWLAFYKTYDQDKIDKFIDDLNQSLRLDPQDALFEFEDGKVNQFKPAQSGRFIAKSDLSTQLNSSLDKLLKSVEESISLDVPFQYIDPIISNQDVNDLGIVELLGQGKSTFTHSSTIRNKNVKRGAEVVSRILVSPDQTFSFNQNLGEVTLENGYHMAYIIRQGRTELDVGGGICQVSTTLFRAALDAGLEIVERHPHAYRVSYYEEDSDPGFDATVFLPSPDLKFKNDTSHHILIQSIYDGSLKTLVYQIYGTSDGRHVTIDNYKKWGYAQPPPDKFIDDPSLPEGKLIREEYAVPGLKTAFDWTVKKDGQVLHKQTFSSSYVPWPAVYRRGTGPTQ